MLAIALPVGLLIGLSLGALGGGGSILTVPALVYLLGQSPHAATTGSLLIVGVSAVAGVGAHWRAGRVRVWPGIAFGALGVAGSYLGTRLSARVDPHVLLAAFAALMLLAAAAMVRRDRKPGATLGEPRGTAAGRGDAPGAAGGPNRAVRADRGNPSDWADRADLSDRATIDVMEGPGQPGKTCSLPSPSPRLDACRAVKVVAAASVVGLLTGFFGVGGGFVIVPALVLALGFEMPVAVGTSLLVIAVNSAAALAARLGTHAHLDWPLLAAFTLAAIAGSFAGNRVASKVNARKLTVAFSLLMIAVAAYTAAQSLPHLV